MSAETDNIDAICEIESEIERLESLLERARCVLEFLQDDAQSLELE